MKKISIFFIFLFLLISINVVFAAELKDNNNDSSQSCTDSGCTLTNPLNPKGGDSGIDSIPELVGQIIQALLGISGSLALVMFIYGGFTWMTAAGNADGVKKGKDILIWATIGLVVIFSAYGLVKLIFSSIGAPGV